jgi:hypothetical protein
MPGPASNVQDIRDFPFIVVKVVVKVVKPNLLFKFKQSGIGRPAVTG